MESGIRVFSVSLAASWILFSMTNASAWFTREHASICVRDASIGSSSAVLAMQGEGVTNAATATGAWMQLVCPLNESTETKKTDMAVLNVHVFDGHQNGYVSATPCVGWYGAPGKACGTPRATGSSFVGQATLSFNATDLNVFDTYLNDFAYMSALLFPKDGSNSASWVAGFYGTN